jgi:hypothetical protein
MREFLRRLQPFIGTESTGRESLTKQGIFHVVAVYGVAWGCFPTLVGLAYGSIAQFFAGHRLGDNPFQFAFSHLFVLSVVPGLIAGFVNARLFNQGIVRFVWLVPFVALLYRFVFTAPGMYPTMLWDSDFGKAFHYFFGGGFKIVGECHTYRDVRTLVLKNMNEIIRGYSQYRWTVPAYVGAAYSIGASLSLLMNRGRGQTSSIQKVVAQATLEG